MLAIWRHRLMAILAAMLAGGCWLSVLGLLRPGSGVASLTLTTSRVGMFAGVGLVLLTGLPAVVLGLVISAAGYSMSGLMVFCAGLLILSAVGGPMTQWLYAVEQNGGWEGLIVELIFWQVFIGVMIWLIHMLRDPVRKRLPDTMLRHDLRKDPSLEIKDLSLLSSGAICAVVSGGIVKFLVRDSDGGQVIMSLIVAFSLGAFVSRLVFPSASVLGILLSPAIVGLLGYGFMLVNINDQQHLELLWFSGRLPGPALALPIQYASAGVLGCVFGIGWAGNSHVAAEQEKRKRVSPDGA